MNRGKIREKHGHTVIYFSSGDALSGAPAFGDCIKPEAARFVAERKRRGRLTAGLSRRVRIKPEAARFIVERKRRGRLTLLVSGDGVRHYRLDGGQNRRR